MRPWYLLPARSNTTDSTPAALARSASRPPTVLALAVLSSPLLRRSASIVDAEARVFPATSSTTWANRCRADLVTTSRGRSGVPHALALVGLRLPQLADVRGDLADGLLVDALHREPGRRLHREGDAVRRLNRHRVAEAERELERRRALGLDAVTHADDRDRLAVDRDVDAGRDRDRELANTRHAGGPPFRFFRHQP